MWLRYLGHLVAFKQLNTESNNFAFSAIDHYIDRCLLAVYALHFKAKAQQSNLSIAEKKILTQLSNRRDIVIKPAKKGGAVVL